LAFMELESVSVEIALPAVVKVSVVERQPVLVWEEDGRAMWIDSKGVAFPPRGEDGPSIRVTAQDVPLSSASDVEADEQDEPLSRYLPPQLVSAILAISVEAPEGTPLVYTNDHGLGWKDRRGWEVYFGMDTDDMEMKLRVYKTLVKNLKKVKINPELISVEYVDAPYFRMER
jgi:cell division protein FtsQ